MEGNGRIEAILVNLSKRFAVATVQPNGVVNYYPEDRELTERDVLDHLTGLKTIAVYPIQPDNTVNFIAFDIDCVDHILAREYTLRLSNAMVDIPHAVEYSAGKGYHIWIFLEEPISAALAKSFAEGIRDTLALPKSGSNHVEVFPKQSEITEGRLGNCLRMPLGVHPRTHRQSVFCNTSEWEAVPLDPFQCLLNKCPAKTIESHTKEIFDPIEKISNAIFPFWSIGKRHELALYLSGFLYHSDWSIEKAIELIKSICRKANDPEIENRIRAVKDSYSRGERNLEVKGFSGLLELLPATVIRSISSLILEYSTPTSVRFVNRIRMSRAMAFEKVAKTVNYCETFLQERGKFLVAENLPTQAFYFDRETKQLLAFGSPEMESFLYRTFGINTREAFGTQVSHALYLEALQYPKVPVFTRSHWDGDKLYVHTGNEYVFILDGEKIERSYNGDCGKLFRTTSIVGEVVPDFEHPVDAFTELVEDINLIHSDNVPVPPEEQKALLEAWILSVFFLEYIRTKPILCLLGSPGSGKTSAIRRIVKVIESDYSDVSEFVPDKPDALRASITHHRLFVLDNMEDVRSGSWLVSMLDSISTGSIIELREFYKTNQLYTAKPECFVAITAVSLPFDQESFYDRILPIEMDRIRSPKPESEIQKRLLDSKPGIWADLINKLNKVVKAIKNLNYEEVPKIRMADFAAFALACGKSGVIDDTVIHRALRSLAFRQYSALMDVSPFVEVLHYWCETNPEDAYTYHTSRQLFDILEPLARFKKVPWRWRNARSLSVHLGALAAPLEKLYNMEVTETRDRSRNNVLAYRFKL